MVGGGVALATEVGDDCDVTGADVIEAGKVVGGRVVGGRLATALGEATATAVGARLFASCEEMRMADSTVTTATSPVARPPSNCLHASRLSAVRFAFKMFPLLSMRSLRAAQAALP